MARKRKKPVRRNCSSKCARENPTVKTKDGRVLKHGWRSKQSAAEFLNRRKRALAKGKKPPARKGKRTTYQSAQYFLSQGNAGVIRPRRRKSPPKAITPKRVQRQADLGKQIRDLDLYLTGFFWTPTAEKTGR